LLHVVGYLHRCTGLFVTRVFMYDNMYRNPMTINVLC